MSIPEDMYFTSTHEWVQVVDEDIVLIGITDHAQHMLGDIVYIELPDTDIHVAAGDELGVIESVKTAADFFAPVSGEILEVNDDAAQSPAIVNKDAYGDGWLVKVKMKDMEELDELLDAQGYHEYVTEEE